MKITIFTSNSLRHIYLIKQLSKISKKIYLFQEARPLVEGKKNSIYKRSLLIEKYFKRVGLAEKKIFKNISRNIFIKNLKKQTLNFGELNLLNYKKFKSFFNSDIYIIFGSSFIKGNLCEFLIRKKAINIHMGVTPFYKGADCNFWALYDGNPDYVGGTIQRLSRKLDSGKTIHIVKPKYNNDPFIFSMSATKDVILKLKNLIKSNKILKIRPVKIDEKKIIRHSKRKQFTEKAIKTFLKKFEIKI